MKRAALSLGALLCVVGPASAQTTVTLLDLGGDVGASPSLAVGADGLALIAYQEGANRDLRVAKCANVACTSATLSTLDSAGDVGPYVAVAIGTDGRGVIAYRDDAQAAVKVARCNDAECTSAALTVVESGVPLGRIGLAIGSDGLPILAYVAGGSLVRAAHCENASCTATTLSTLGAGSPNAAIVIGSDGLPVIASQIFQGQYPVVRRCNNVACTTGTLVSPPVLNPLVNMVSTPTGMAVPADGRVLIAHTFFQSVLFNPIIRRMKLSRCADLACSSQAFPITLEGSSLPPDVAVQPNGLGWFAHLDELGRIHLRACTDASCATQTETCALVDATELALERAGDGRSLAAFHQRGGGLGIAHDLSDACPLSQLRVDDVWAAEGTDARFTLTLAPPAGTPVNVSYMTSDGTAVAGEDYVATGGFLTFAPGQTSAEVRVPTLPDAVNDPTETFFLDLFPPIGASLADGHAVGTIANVAYIPPISAGACERTEGDSGTAGCAVPVTIPQSTTLTVTVAYTTTAGTATEGVDYQPVAGTLTFAPGEVAQTVFVPVVGDTSVELDETFFVTLANPISGTIADGSGEGTIEDDDAPSLSSVELTHGASVQGDLAAAAGPTADADLFRLGQGPYSSWEVAADGVSGDVDLVLERRAEDNLTVLQAGASDGAGPARAMRWQHRSARPEGRQHLRVRSASCTTDCGADDTYRLRAYETTGVIPRFNNSGSQVTVLVLQNPTSQAIEANADFWDAGGQLLATSAVTLQAKQVYLGNTSSIAALVGRSGTITVTHDGSYGALVGKTVALEPTTGFSFDSPMLVRMR